jgi:indolepyruvate decarboxylase
MKFSDYVFERLSELGVSDVFCVPGESVQGLYRSLLTSDVRSVLLSHEPSVGYAADAYSRIKGLGALLVSYGVGSLNVVNAVGQAYAESSPMIVLSGGPGTLERTKHQFLHHKVRTFQTQQKVFEEITAMSVIIDSPNDAALKLEQAFQTALQFKKPVYVEIPRDICNCNIQAQPFPVNFQDVDDPDSINEALDEVVDLINNAQNPVILGDVEVSRVKMQKEFVDLVEKTGLPVASTILGKSVISESHSQSLGTFSGKLSNEVAREKFEAADLILCVGSILSDVSLGMFSFQLDRSKVVESRIEYLQIKNHIYPKVSLRHFLKGVANHPKLKKRQFKNEHLNLDFKLPKYGDEKVSINNLTQILNHFINRDKSPAYRVVGDVGDCLFVGQSLHINNFASFLSPAYYLSMGFAVPGGIGAQIADPTKRPLILVGDGAFQMTGLEIISAVRLNLNPIIILFNNGIYATLDKVEDASIENSYDIGKYDYYKMASIFGAVGYQVNHAHELQTALKEAETSNKDKAILIQINLDPTDTSDVLKKFGTLMGKSNKEASKES